jgi:hypothetical protein
MSSFHPDPRYRLGPRQQSNVFRAGGWITATAVAAGIVLLDWSPGLILVLPPGIGVLFLVVFDSWNDKAWFGTTWLGRRRAQGRPGRRPAAGKP